MSRTASAIALGLALAVLPAAAQVSDIYKCTDEKGRPLYTSDKRDTVGKTCERVKREVSVVPAPGRGGAAASRKASPKDFPRESVNDRAQARESQRKVLEREIEQERTLLAKAKTALAEQESVRSGDERNYAKVLARLQPYKDTVEVHRKNIEALERELRALYR